MKILLAVPYSPYPVTRGFDRLMVNLIDGLSANNRVVLVTMCFSEREIDLLKSIERDGLAIKPMIAPNKRSICTKIQFKLMNAIRLAAKGITPEVSYASPSRFLDLIAGTAEEESPDLIVSSYWSLYQVPRMLPDFRNVLLTLDLDYLAVNAKLAFSNGPIRRRVDSLRARLNERAEKEAYRLFDSILTVTDLDTENLRSEFGGPKKNISTLPISIDLEEFGRHGTERSKDKLLITGNHISDFNRDALRYFILDVMPGLRKRRPSISLTVAGSTLSEDRDLLSGPGIEFTGHVEDLPSVLAEASMLVLPLRFGGGIRIRMLEAAAAGTPVVSTRKGVEGMGLEDGREYIEANTPEQLVESITRLLDDPALADSIGRNARVWVENNYSPADYTERLDSLLRDIIG